MKSHYFSENQEAEEKRNYIKETLLGYGLGFETTSGVFSPKKIDKGSRVLIDNCNVNRGERVLDLGCGYGPVGISIAKAYNASVVMTDLNKRAVRMARKNAKINNVKAEIKQGDGFENIEGSFDAILFNPPQSAGKDMCESLIREAKEYLKENGTLQIVARKNKGGKSLGQFMEGVFGNIGVLAKSSGYWVYSSTNC